MHLIGKVVAYLAVGAIFVWLAFFLVAVFVPLFGDLEIPFVRKNCYGIYMERNVLDANDKKFRPYCFGINMY